MCPLRLILVFFSAVLAGYFAWKSVGSSSSSEESESIMSSDPCSSSRENQENSFIKMVQNGFWVFIDMASGGYLWRNLRGIRESQTMKMKVASS